MSENFDSEMLSLQGATNFGFSAIGIDALEADEYTLVSIAVDSSGSISPYRDDIIRCLKSTVESCSNRQTNPNADKLLIRVTIFGPSGGVEEVHGFKPIEDIALNDYDNILDRLGNTPLYDAISDMAGATNTYARKLFEEEFTSNGIGIVITDGHHYANTLTTLDDAATANRNVLTHEHLESWLSLLVGVNVDSTTQTNANLKNVHDTCGFDTYTQIGETNAESMGRLAKFISKSISSQSTALGSGAASQALTF